MADNSVFLKKGNANIGTGAGGEGGAPSVVASAPAEVQDISDVLTLCSQPTQLSPDGEAYMGKVEEVIRGKFPEVKTHKVSGNNYEARVVQVGDKTVSFVFTETYMTSTPEYPVASVKFADFDNVLKSNGLDPAKNVEFFVITPEDYSRADKMGTWVTNLFVGENSQLVKNLSARGYSNGKYRITTDLTVCKNFIDKIWPLATLPRMDTAFMLYSVKTVENAFDRQGRPEQQITPILAVSAYTDFKTFNPDTGLGFATPNQRRHAPFVVVTGIYSRICAPAMVTTGISLAAYMFILRGCWLKPYTTFAKGAPDIGNLISNQKGMPAYAASVADVNLILENNLTTKLPYLAIDIQVGTPFMPVLMDLAQNQARFNSLVDTFTGGEGARSAGKTWQQAVVRFDGRVNIVKNGVSEASDTRAVDYLSLLASGAPVNEANGFLRPLADAGDTTALLKHFYPKAELLYLTNRVVINPTWVMNVANDLNKCLSVDVEGALDPNTYDIGSLQAFTPVGMGMMPFTGPRAGGIFQNFYF